nr:MAG TPA: zinc finger protein [Caudoviricetes sp.]
MLILPFLRRKQNGNKKWCSSILYDEPPESIPEAWKCFGFYFA